MVPVVEPDPSVDPVPVPVPTVSLFIPPPAIDAVPVSGLLPTGRAVN